MAGLRLFLCVAPEDTDHAQRLERALAPLLREGALSTSSVRGLLGGDDVAAALERALAQAQALLLMLSPDLLASDGLWALYQRARGRADLRIVPVLLRPCSYQMTELRAVHVLPGDGRAVTEWDNEDAAWVAIAAEVERLLRPGAPIPVVAARPRRRWWFAGAAVGSLLIGAGLWGREPRPPADMVRLPGGPFTLVEPYRASSVVAPYWLDRDEVTRADFLSWLAGRGGRDGDGALLWDAEAAGGTAPSRLPVAGVTYEGARRYCAARGRRLPRYEEWDLAARGTGRMQRFAWGEEAPRCDGVVFARGGGVCGAAGSGPAEVGSAAQDRSAEGVRDLAGGVSEWVERVGEATYGRGGSFARGAEACQSGYYIKLEPAVGYRDVGFRCARDAAAWGF